MSSAELHQLTRVNKNLEAVIEGQKRMHEDLFGRPRSSVHSVDIIGKLDRIAHLIEGNTQAIRELAWQMSQAR